MIHVYFFKESYYIRKRNPLPSSAFARNMQPFSSKYTFSPNLICSIQTKIFQVQHTISFESLYTVIFLYSTSVTNCNKWQNIYSILKKELHTTERFFQLGYLSTSTCSKFHRRLRSPATALATYYVEYSLCKNQVIILSLLAFAYGEIKVNSLS